MTDANRSRPDALSASNDNPFQEPGATDQDLSGKSGSYFPRRYLTDMFRFIEANNDKLSVNTYEDLEFPTLEDARLNYPSEYSHWTKKVKADPAKARKAHIFLQYDIDSRPERLHGLLKEETHTAVPANIMIFNRRIDRRHLKNTGVVRTTQYDLDEALLKSSQKRGFVIGYHTNAYELAGFDVERALKVFDEDMTALNTRFGVRFFSAHGGVPDQDGRNNNGLPYHPAWRKKAIWVHNGISLRFAGSFSDGGHNSPARDPEGRDLRRLFEKMEPGRRYRILLHPQYYDIDFNISERFTGTAWYDDILAQHQRNPSDSLWKNVTLAF